MRCDDLKRAVEDVVLRPDENRVDELQKRGGTIAALDLCRFNQNAQSTSSASTPRPASCVDVVVTNTPVPADHSMRPPPPPLCASSSLDAIMFRAHPSILHRNSTSGSRRHSRVYSSLTASSKRKRSNSLTNYAKSHSVSLPPSARQTPSRLVNEEDAIQHSLPSSDSRSSMARSDASNGYVLEEEESYHTCIDEAPSLMHSNHSSSSSSFNAYRIVPEYCEQMPDDCSMECD